MVRIINYENRRESSKYRTLCCHVKSATLAWGFLNLILQLIVLAAFTLLVIQPYVTNDIDHKATDLKLSNIFLDGLKALDEDSTLRPYFESMDNKVRQIRKNPYFSYKVSSFSIEDAHVGLIVTLSAFLLTCLLIHGILANKPGYLIPFFSLQIFDLSLTILTFLGYYTYPDVKTYIKSTTNSSLTDSHKPGDNSYLDVSAFIFFLLIVLFKVYFINLVWTCYKYLCNRRETLKINYIKVEPETSSLPDYETAIKMPPTEFIVPQTFNSSAPENVMNNVH